MRLVSIASGSSGNCIYIGSDQTHILVDAGITNKRIQLGIQEIGITGSELSGVFITHEHSDHIKGLSILAKHHGVPIYATEETLRKIREMKYLDQYPSGLLRAIEPDKEVSVGDLTVLPFAIDHDAVDPVAYRISDGEKHVAVATDLGHYDRYIINHLQGLDAIVLEANHDEQMVQVGPYPYYLKRRILGNHGHLSNENAGRLLCEILNDKLKHVVLGHLSKENNYEQLAYETVKVEVNQSATPYDDSCFHLMVAKRDVISQIIYV